MFEANKIEMPEFVEEIQLHEAIELLQQWALENSEHGIMFQAKDSGFACTIVTLSKVLPELIICGPKPSTYIFKIVNAKFGLGPFATMEFPEKVDSQISGLHIYLESGSFLFIANQAQIPSSPLARLHS